MVFNDFGDRDINNIYNDIRVQFIPMTELVSFKICLECSKKQRNCCQDNRVPLTLEDINNITSLGFNFFDFAIAGEYKVEIFINEETWWKNSMITIDNKHYKINTKNDEKGNCVFLNSGLGCTLGKNRPSVCKIYPFWVNDKEEIIYEKGEDELCYFGRKKKTILESAKLVGEDEKSLKSYFEKIKNDCIENKEKHQELISKILRKKETIGIIENNKENN